MLQNLQNFAKFQTNQVDILVDFEKCCKTHICLQRSAPIQPKTSEILPKICKKLATTLTPKSPKSAFSAALLLPYQAAEKAAAAQYGCAFADNGDPESAATDVRAGVRGRVSKIGKNLQIFGGLVLGGIKTKFCKKICV